MIVLTTIDRIRALKKEKNAVILAHYYTYPEIQEVADYVGDSLYLSKIAKDLDEDLIAFCGVRFMAESAKILAKDKKVLHPNKRALCPMVAMASLEDIERAKAKNKEAKVVSYVNSSTEVKTVSDLCCTSSNAKKLLEAYPHQEIIFVPDKNLGGYIAKDSHKNIELWQGFCPVHEDIRRDKVLDFLEAFKEDIEVLAHPECNEEVRDLADFIGSTGQIIDYAKNSKSKNFLILTEEGILYELENATEDKVFYNLNTRCQAMKEISLEDLYYSLKNESGEILIDEEIIEKAKKPLNLMFELV